jgi:hypothetical protein
VGLRQRHCDKCKHEERCKERSLPIPDMGHPLSPDAKPVNGRSQIMHVVRSLGDLTRCKSFDFETCIKQCRASIAISRMQTSHNLSLYKFCADHSRIPRLARMSLPTDAKQKNRGKS